MKKPEYLNNIKTYFTFSKGERNGIIFLIILLALVITGIKLIPEVSSEQESGSYNELKKQVDSLFVKSDTIQASFHKKPGQSPDAVKSHFVEREKLLLNSCDSAMLTELPGIGPVLASRIIKYRNLLGGYNSIHQLKEVYGLKEENFEKARNLLIIEKDKIIKFSIDTAGFKTLVRHPYIGKEMAWRIINLRKKLGKNYLSKELLNSYQVCDSVQWSKLEPYIILEKNSLSE